LTSNSHSKRETKKSAQWCVMFENDLKKDYFTRLHAVIQFDYAFGDLTRSTFSNDFTLWSIVKLKKSFALVLLVVRDSAVGIATRYGLDGPGIESRWNTDFLHLSISTLQPTQPPIRWAPGLFRG
jgi:hypothetical protein